MEILARGLKGCIKKIIPLLRFLYVFLIFVGIAFFYKKICYNKEKCKIFILREGNNYDKSRHSNFSIKKGSRLY